MANYSPAIEPNRKIEITIDTSGPIELNDFTGMMDAFGGIFYTWAKKEDNSGKIEPSMYLSEIRKGSYVLDLVCAAVPTIPIVLQNGICSAAYDFIKSNISNLIAGKKPESEEEKRNLLKSGIILKPIAKDNGSQLNFNYIDNSITNNYNVTSDEAKRAMNNYNEILRQDCQCKFYKQMPMVWKQTNFDSNTQGNRAIIQSINPKPLKVIFEDEKIKNIMTSPHSEFDEPWQDLIYVVDVIVEEIDGKPKYYRITKIYPELTETQKDS